MPRTAIPSMSSSIATARSSIRNTEPEESGRFAGRWPAPVWSPKTPNSIGDKIKGRPQAAFCHSSQRPSDSALVADARALWRLWDGCGCRGGRGFVQDAVMNGEQRQFQPVRHTDLVVDVAQLVLDHLLGRTQLGGDFLVLVSLHDERHYAEFLGRQAVADAQPDHIVL